jgi:hypothetical protein
MKVNKDGKLEPKRSKITEAEFTAEAQYQDFLRRMGLFEDLMHETQKKQLRDSFFAGLASMMFILREDLVDMPEAEGVEILENISKELFDHFQQYIPDQD